MLELWNDLRYRLRALFHRGALEQELDDEMRFHIEREMAKHTHAGAAADLARRKAHLAFGDVETVKEASRDVRGVRWVEETFADVRYGLRSLRRHPALAFAAIFTLALGIGASATIFSIVNAAILRPLPFRAPDQLLMLSEDNPEKGWRQNVVAPANFLDWRERVSSFQDVAAYAGGGAVTLTGSGTPQLLTSAATTGNLFSLLGIRAQLGRTFTDAETWRGDAPVAVLSDRLWREAFAADRNIVGRTILLDGVTTSVVGVMPPDFIFPSKQTDLWQPTAWDPADRGTVPFRRRHQLRVIARLKPGVSPRAADAELQGVVHQLQQEYPATNKVMGAEMTPLHDFLIGNIRQPLFILQTAVTLLLLISCANVGNLLLVHAASRGKEVSLRLTLGASARRLIRQTFTESVALSAIGGAFGLAFAAWATRWLVAMAPSGQLMLRMTQVGLDWRVGAYTLLITACSGIVFGLAPVFWNMRRAPAEMLRGGARGNSGGRGTRRWGNGLVIGEVAVALLLTLGAGLLVRSFMSLIRVDAGFDSRHVLAATMVLPTGTYNNPDKQRAFTDELVRRAQAIPGVSDAAVAIAPPLTGVPWTGDFHIAGHAPDDYGTEIAHEVVTPGYFQLLRIPVIAGRGVTDIDRSDGAPVVVINQTLARRYFPAGDAVGQRLTFSKLPDSTSLWMTIVGVVGDVRQTSPAIAAQAEAIVPFAQQPNPAVTLFLRTAAAPASVGPSIRRVIATLDPSLPIAAMSTLDDVRDASVTSQRFLMTLLLLFAITGLALAVVGVYGVMSQLAAGRAREIGIRLAIGAQVPAVQWLVVRHGLRLALSGAGVGIAGSLVAARAIASQLYGIHPFDITTFVAVPMLLLLSAATAAWIPARRASRMDPVAALRAE